MQHTFNFLWPLTVEIGSYCIVVSVLILILILIVSLSLCGINVLYIFIVSVSHFTVEIASGKYCRFEKFTPSLLS